MAACPVGPAAPLKIHRRILSPVQARVLERLGDAHIACMKLAAVSERGSRKDFVDIYALGQRLSLGEMLGLYERKYGFRDCGHVLFALTYFDDAEREPMPRMLRRWPWTRIKTAIRAWVSEVAG